VPANDRVEIRISGSGGQGVILAATLIADAAVASGREVLATQSYGPEARGGHSKADVIVADGTIDFPEVAHPSVTVCLSQQAFDAFAAETASGGLVLFDERLVDSRPIAGVRLVGLPFTDVAERRLGKAIAANVIAVGAVRAVSDLVTDEALAEALTRHLPPAMRDLNQRALQLGAELIRDAGHDGGS
jgi:2-oxoglutarate ferredoxin oxidoreductase subunit gamma